MSDSNLRPGGGCWNIPIPLGPVNLFGPCVDPVWTLCGPCVDPVWTLCGSYP